MGIKIKQLGRDLANQIAAGEVIERPASVVKELLENAYDAGADRIDITIGYGGLNQITISDNGEGILAEDLPLTIMAHATSKIRSTADLAAIESMGFRGEALASIASVARVKITSKTDQQPNACCLMAEGEHQDIFDAAHGKGTTIDVRDLFYNMPVRKKFLKSERLEFLAIESVVKCFALSASHIHIQLNHNGRKVLELNAAMNPQAAFARVSQVLGRAFAKEAVYIESKRGDMMLYGWISGPGYQRSQNDRQWFYINRRMVKDKLIQHAVRQAYEPYLHPGRFPACLLYLSLPFGELDVNVHPAKHEVRFQQPRLIHDFICSQLSECLSQQQPVEPPREPSAFSPPTALEIREQQPSLPNPLKNWASAAVSNSQWIVLNQRYVLTMMEHQAYLLDALDLQRYWQQQELTQHGLPLPHRPLLLPLIIQLPEAQLERIKSSREILAQWGLWIEVNEQGLRIKSIPVLFPGFDFQQFFSKLDQHHLEENQAMQGLLIHSQRFDAFQLSAEERQGLMLYFQSLMKEKPSQPFCRILTEDQCRHFFSETLSKISAADFV